MIGDIDDMAGRLRMVLPARWFGDTTPVLDAVLTGLAQAWSGLYGLLAAVQSQSRIATASGVFLDIAAADYLGGVLPRRAGEADAAYSARIRGNLLTKRATRAGVVQALTNLTGRSPRVFEPLNATDTGGYNVNLGYNTAGGYGIGPGGYGAAPLVFGASAEFAGTVSDAEIYAAVAAVLPTNCIAWTQISN
jgi:hypothetical protein